VLLVLWTLPVLFYVAIGMVALYQAGWLFLIGWSLPLMWLAAWLVGKLWKPPRQHSAVDGDLLQAPEFWTPWDVEAIAIVEAYRSEAENVDRDTITDLQRYYIDAQTLAGRLAEHYHVREVGNALHPVTVVEILAVIHLAVEDLEQWVLQNVPGSDVATIGHLNRLPRIIRALDAAQTVVYFASAIVNPSRLLTYPLWRKSGRVSVEIQNELIRGFYQRYLRQVGYYLIEMYSGRLKAGSRAYREQFGELAAAVHAAGGNVDTLSQLQDAKITIAVMGQVKAGKSSLINRLIGDEVAATGVLPETRAVKRYEYLVPNCDSVVTLLDTPGYDEADVKEQQRREVTTAADLADIVLLVMAANVSARAADVQMMRELETHYQDRPHLKPPTILAVLTHIDLLRPVREWSPPYDWRNPHELKEESIAAAVDYVRELFGDRIADYACVHTDSDSADATSVADEVVPVLLEHIPHGKSAAVLKAFYRKLGQQRLQQLTRQVIGLAKAAANL
jgi:predicted GTPase